jgi:hypothetical protein
MTIVVEEDEEGVSVQVVRLRAPHPTPLPAKYKGVF